MIKLLLIIYKQISRMSDIKVVQYTDRSIAVFGDTKNHKEKLKELGGRYNTNLKQRKGWILSNNKKDELLSFLEEAIGEKFVVVQDEPENVSRVSQTGKQVPVMEQIKSVPQRLEFPNMFTSSDGLNYQIVMYTVPLPKANQKAIICDSEFIVKSVGSKKPPYDSIVLVDTSDPTIEYNAYLVAGKWVTGDFSEPDEVKFQPI